MEGGRRRARLTPMSGELRATEDWIHVEPVEAKPKKRRKRKPPPQTTLGMLVYGLRRFVLIAGALCLAVALGAYLVAWLGGGRFVHVLTLAFYFAGAFFGAVAFLGGTGPYNRWYWDRAEREETVNRSFVFICIAALMFGIGVALEVLA
jgi:hypothetical protein